MRGRWIWRVALATAVTPLLAMLALNVFLNAGLPVLLNLRPDRLRVTYDRAWSWIPGAVDVRGLRIAIRDSVGRWTIAVDHATGDVALRPLLDRRFVVSRPRGEGALVRFETIPEPPPPPAGPPWSVELSDATLDDLREIAFDAWRVTGEMRATGGLVTGETWLGLRSVAIDLPGAQVFLAEVPVATRVHGRATLSADGDPLDPDEIIGGIDAGATLRADIGDLGFLSPYLQGAPWLKVRGGAGTLDADLRLEDGRFLPGSRLHAEASGIVADFLSYAVSGDGDVRFDVAEAGAALVVAFSDYDITLRGDATPHVEGKGFQVTARAPEVGLHAPPALDVVLDLPPSVIRDAGVYNVYLPTDVGFTLTEGRGTVRGRLEASTETGVATGWMKLDGRRVKARFDELTITGDLALTAKLREGDLDAGRYDISGTTLALDDVGIVENGEPRPRSERWWADVSLPDGKVAVGAPVFLDTRLDVAFRDSSPFVSMFSQRARVPGWIQGLLAVRGVTGTARVRLGDDLLDLPDFHLRGGPYEVQLQVRRVRDDLKGDLFARYGLLSVGIARKGEDTQVHLFRAREWFEGRGELK